MSKKVRKFTNKTGVKDRPICWSKLDKFGSKDIFYMESSRLYKSSFYYIRGYNESNLVDAKLTHGLILKFRCFDL